MEGMKFLKRVIIKAVIFLILISMISFFFDKMMYSVSANIAVSQLNGDNVDYTIQQVFNAVKNNSYIIKLVLFLIFFAAEIKQSIKILLEKEEI